MKKIYISVIIFILVLGVIFIVKNSAYNDKNDEFNNFINDLDKVNNIKLEERINKEYFLVKDTDDVAQVINLLKEVKLSKGFTTVTFNEDDVRYKISLYNNQTLTHEYYFYPDYIKLENEYLKVENLNKVKILEILEKN